MQFTALLADAERQVGNPTRALDLARQVLAADASASEARYYAAMALLSLDRRPEAIKELEQLVAAGVTPVNVVSSLGTAYLDEGQIGDATRVLGLAVQAAPQRPDLHVLLGRAHRLAGRLSEGERELALALPPGANRQASAFYESVEADVHLETGLIRLAQSQLDAAVVELRAALDLRPSHGPTHRHLAAVYLRQEQRDLAAAHAAAARDAGEALPDSLAALLPATAQPSKGQP
jgi:tetratricopeptide (TPR) repeat protein